MQGGSDCCWFYTPLIRVFMEAAALVRPLLPFVSIRCDSQLVERIHLCAGQHLMGLSNPPLHKQRPCPNNVRCCFRHFWNH